MKKLFWAMVMLMLAGMLLSCGGSKEPAATNAPVQDGVGIYVNGATEYKIVRGQRSSEEVKWLMSELLDAMKDRLGTAPLVGDDWVKDEAALEEDACEILLGDTNRPESAKLKESLPDENSYAISVKGKRVYIVAASDRVLNEAVSVFIEEIVMKNDQKGNLYLSKDYHLIGSLPAQRQEGWEFLCPSPNGGTLSPGVYYSGAGLADDTKSEPLEGSRMKYVADVTQSDFDAYVADMKTAGYRVTMENTIEKNCYANFVKGCLRYYVGFCGSTREMRISEDRAGVSVDEFAYTAKGDQQTQVYQYGISPSDIGMCYVIRLSDNSVVIVDGGQCIQTGTEHTTAFMDFLRKITNTPDGKKVKVAAWFLTHAHNDHVTFMRETINKHYKEFELQRVMYNFPSYQVRQEHYDTNTFTTKQAIRNRYPDTQFLKLHSGQSFYLSDVRVEVLYTHEDVVGANQYKGAADAGTLVQFPLSDFNDTSSVVRFHVDGQSFLVLGDMNAGAERVMTNQHPAKVWKSDMVQVAHHCYNALNTLYPYVSAPIALIPNTRAEANNDTNIAKLTTVLKFVKNKQAYYAPEATIGFAVVDGKFQIVYNKATTWE